MGNFLNNVISIIPSIRTWLLDCMTLIRSNPFLLFTVGFVALGYTIAVLGRLLSRE